MYMNNLDHVKYDTGLFPINTELECFLIHKQHTTYLESIRTKKNLCLKMKVSMSLILITLSALVTIAKAYDPSPLQDFCVAIDDPKNGGAYITRFLNSLLINYYSPLLMTKFEVVIKDFSKQYFYLQFL